MGLGYILLLAGLITLPVVSLLGPTWIGSVVSGVISPA